MRKALQAQYELSFSTFGNTALRLTIDWLRKNFAAAGCLYCAMFRPMDHPHYIYTVVPIITSDHVQAWETVKSRLEQAEEEARIRNFGDKQSLEFGSQ